MSIEVRGVNKKYGSFQALHNINLSVSTGDLIALLGPSGSGKTTLLRIIAGLETPDTGCIFFHGEDATRLSTRDRKVGFVFQHYALFKQMTVFENVAFGLRVRPRSLRLPETKIRAKVNELLKLVQMEWLADRYPSQLSGGQRQRIALARALAVEPRVMLLDEPFGALDAKVRKELRRWIRHLHNEIRLTSIFVTHDQDEALEVADQVVIMNEGKIIQIGTPEEVYERPVNLFVYKFLGNVNLFRGRVKDENMQIINEQSVASLRESTNQSLNEHVMIAYARPHEMEITRERNVSGAIETVISHIRAIGPMVHVELKKCDDGDLIEAELSKERYQQLDLKVSEHVYAQLRNLKVFMEDY